MVAISKYFQFLLFALFHVVEGLFAVLYKSKHFLIFLIPNTVFTIFVCYFLENRKCFYFTLLFLLYICFSLAPVFHVLSFSFLFLFLATHVCFSSYLFLLFCLWSVCSVKSKLNIWNHFWSRASLTSAHTHSHIQMHTGTLCFFFFMQAHAVLSHFTPSLPLSLSPSLALSLSFSLPPHYQHRTVFVSP